MDSQKEDHESLASPELSASLSSVDYSALLSEARERDDGGVERLSETEIGTVIAAVGNHEAKALLLLAMEPGVVYSRADLKRLFDGIQGEKRAWDMDSAGLFRYCADSLAPIGMVAKDEVHITGQPGYAKTPRGETLGDVVAAEMLDFSLNHPNLSLIELMGRTSVSSGNKENRTPIVRLKMFYELATSELPISQVELLMKTGIESNSGYNGLIQHLAELDIITLHERGNITEDMTVYHPVPDRFGREREFPAQYSGAIYSFLEGKEEGYKFTISSLTEDLANLGLVHEGETQDVKRAVRSIVSWSVIKGGVQIDQELTRLHTSQVDLRPDQLALLEDLLMRAYAIERQELVETERAKEIRNRILSNPDIVRALAAKARDKSFMVQDMPTENRREQVYNTLANTAQPMTIAELSAAGVEGSIHQVRRRLYELVAAGRVQESKERGGFKTYSLVETNGTDESDLRSPE